MGGPAILVLGGVLALLAGCDRVASLGNAVSKQAFERRCEGLPAGRVEVVRTPSEVGLDPTRSQGDLERLADSVSPQHRTVGLTRASFGYRSTIELEGLEDPRGGRACAHPSVRVEVALTAMTVYVAREYRGDACREPLILAHEHQHVDVFERYADEATRTLGGEIETRLGKGARYGTTMPLLQETLKSDLAAWLDAFMAHSRDELATRHAAVDTPQEYAMLAKACGPVP